MSNAKSPLLFAELFCFCSQVYANCLIVGLWTLAGPGTWEQERRGFSVQYQWRKGGGVESGLVAGRDCSITFAQCTSPVHFRCIAVGCDAWVVLLRILLIMNSKLRCDTG